jgi:hypothetical protein
MSSKPIINGVEVPMASAKKTVQAGQSALISKAARKKLAAKDLSDMFEKATQVTQVKFAHFDVSIHDPETLNKSSDLGALINSLKAHHTKYDFSAVFTIVKPDSADPDDTSKYQYSNLYTDYPQVTVSEVAESNEWWATMTDDNVAYMQDLKATLDHLIANSEDSLVNKVNETHLKYPAVQQGGPLFFKIMLDMLQDNSEDSAEFIISQVKNLKISEEKDEDVETVITKIRTAEQRLKNLKTRSGRAALPEEFPDYVLKVFQTSSSLEFNDLFKTLGVQQQITALQSKTTGKTRLSTDEIISWAESRYRSLKTKEEWSGASPKTHASIFVAQSSGPTCFNCGGPHTLKECSKPHDVDRIKANKSAFWENKKAKKGTPAKAGSNKGGKGPRTDEFAPPTAEEKKNKSRRVIKGKLMFYHYKKKKWFAVQTDNAAQPAAAAAAAAAAATVPVPAPVPVAVQAPPASAPAGLMANNQAQEVALLNATQAMTATMRNFLMSLNK